MKRLMSLLMVTLVMLGPVQLQATSSAPPPDIEISVVANPGFGGPVRGVFRDRLTAFGASIELSSGFLPKGDLYFGFLQPGNTNPHTWAREENSVLLLKGMHPFLEDIDLRSASLSTSSILGKDIEHAFAGTDPTGMYMVFVLIVIANTNPADHANWYGVETTPLFVE